MQKPTLRQFDLSPYDIPILMNFIMELNSKKRDTSRREWALKILEKYKSTYSKGRTEKSRIKLYNCLEKLAQDWIKDKMPREKP